MFRDTKPEANMSTEQSEHTINVMQTVVWAIALSSAGGWTWTGKILLVGYWCASALEKKL